MKYGDFSLTERFYSWDIVTYDEPIIFDNFLRSHCSNFAYIKHDCDCKDTGELKEVHYHIVAIFKINKSFNWLKDNFIHEQNVFFLPITKGYLRSAYRYLLHLDNEDKYQYSINFVVHSDCDYFKKFLDSENSCDTFLDDLLSDDFNIYAFSLKYGRDFIKNFKRYLEFRDYVKGINKND